MPSTAHSEQLAVQHMRDPCEGRPIRGVVRNECPGHTAPRESGAHVTVFGHVIRVVVVEKIKVADLTVDRKRDNKQGQIEIQIKSPIARGRLRLKLVWRRLTMSDADAVLLNSGYSPASFPHAFRPLSPSLAILIPQPSRGKREALRAPNMPDPQLIRCTNCGAVNRVPLEKVQQGREPVCGRCKKPLTLSSQPVTVTDANFSSEVEQSPLPVVIDMWASWCGPCRMLAPVVDQIASMVGRIRVGKLNVDENPITAQRFNIQSIPALLVLKGGREIDRIVGLQPKLEIVRRLERVIV